jgi:hypothetical protein
MNNVDTVATSAFTVDITYLVKGSYSNSITFGNVFSSIPANILVGTSNVYYLGNSNFRFQAIYLTEEIHFGNASLRKNQDNLIFSGNVTAGSYSTLGGAAEPTLKSLHSLGLYANASGGGGAVVVTNTPVRFSSFTTSQRDTQLLPANGDVIMNTTLNRLQVYADFAWRDLN